MKELQLDDKLNFVEEPVEVMDREIKQLKRSHIPIVKVRWNSKRGPEFTWEREDEIRAKYPHLFSIITSSSIKSRDEISDVKFYLGKCFPMKDLGEAAYILGIKIYRDRSNRLVGLYQSEYIEKILKRFKIENSKLGRSIMYAAVVKNILKYLMNTKYMFRVYAGDLDEELRVTCYTDDGYEIDADDIKSQNIKSQTCYVFVLNGGDVDRKSAK
ncbi:retrotransposon protein, putative, ty1-copia subclass [Tanacetum coccineum]|uniref:Retrotransposon protein, putative, ty1-copia subclass n=1 Tax=Tanacetum coccineum TaxID=301880 RepID=A0ABQ5BM02_9ASTR